MENRNDITLVGTVVDQPKHQTHSSSRSASLRVFTDVEYRKGYHTVKAWNEIADGLKDLQEGDTVIVKGSVRYRSYENQEGVKKYVTEINADSVEIAGNPL